MSYHTAVPHFRMPEEKENIRDILPCRHNSFFSYYLSVLSVLSRKLEHLIFTKFIFYNTV